MKGAGRVQELCRQTEIVREARGKRNESKSAREGGREQVLERDRKMEVWRRERAREART